MFHKIKWCLIGGVCVSSALIHAADESTENVKSDEDICVQEYASEHWLDKTQAVTFTGMCKTVRWFDRLFGKEKPFDDEKFGGKVVLGFKETERDSFDPKLRVRIKSKLPNASKRMNAFIGRVDEDEFISDSNQRPDAVSDSASVRRNEEQESEWLIGLGYSNPKNKKKGFDYSIGAKISSGLNPFTKVRYRYNFRMPETHFLRATQTLFWQNDDGYGTTTNLNYSYVYSYTDIFEIGASAKFTEDENQWEWVTGASWFHRLQNGHGIAARTYIRGEEENSESIPEYGVVLTYRRPFLRDWLFLEAAVQHQWIQDNAGEPRDQSFGFGLQFEMEVGDYRRRRKD